MVFYYTGTGNSKYAAERLLAVTGGDLVSIAECENSSKYDFTLAEGEKLGFIFPVYSYTVPMTVQEFVKKLNVSSDREIYSYAVATCGASTGNTLKLFNKLYPVSAVFGLPMIDNYIPFLSSAPTKSQQEAELSKADEILNGIINQISQKSCGYLNVFEGAGKLMASMAAKHYAKHRSTSDFNVNDNCVGCGLCESICPTHSIKLVNEKPTWVNENCDLCFGCLHRCPKEAINFKDSTQGKGRYINPKTTL